MTKTAKRPTASKKKVIKTPRMTDITDILDGLVRIYRTPRSGDVWQMRMYVQSEQKYVRKSLKTRDKRVALELAKDEGLIVLSKVRNGEKVFSITAGELQKLYLAHITEQVTGNQISEGRARNIKSFTNRYVEFLGNNETIQNIPERKFIEYRQFRQKQVPTIKLTVIVNESITIKQMYRWAVAEGLLQKHYLPDFGKIKVPIDDTRRDGYTLEEYTQLVDAAGKWYQKVPTDHPTREQEVYYRRSIRDFIVLMGNFGFRTGELRQLQYMNVKVHPDKTATVTVQPETTKVKRKREVRGRRGDIFARRKTYSPFIKREDYIFSNFSSNTPLSMETLYAYFHELAALVQNEHPNFDVEKTPYSLRHFYISYHLLSGKVSPYEIAKLAGTSVKQIEKHYDHVQNSHIAKKILGSQTRIDRKNWEILIDDVDRFEK